MLASVRFDGSLRPRLRQSPVRGIERKCRENAVVSPYHRLLILVRRRTKKESENREARSEKRETEARTEPLRSLLASIFSLLKVGGFGLGHRIFLKVEELLEGHIVFRADGLEHGALIDLAPLRRARPGLIERTRIVDGHRRL
jgi:hypothetical protein